MEDPSKHSSYSAECRYRLDTDTSSTLILPDGRTLGYARYGLESPTGPTIFYVHGMPGARLEVASFDTIASRLGARIISVDRPSYGWSSPHPNRTILDHAKDIECLAGHLRVDSYGVLGISGGGPYALACAYSLPADKLKAVSIVCGLGPPDIGYAGTNWFHWLGFRYGKYVPGLTRWWFSREPVARLDLSDDERMKRFMHDINKSKSKMHPKDRKMFEDIDQVRLFVRNAREAYTQGLHGFAEDMKLATSNFGFRIEDVRKDLPVQLWYGKHDTDVPPRHGEQIAQRLGEQATLRIEDAAHAGIYYHYRQEILEELVKAMTAS